MPDKVLAQLGNRVQHALRAFTPRDQKAVRAAAETFRANPKLDTATVISELGKGEALVSFLEGNGTPSMVERCMVRPPSARVGPVTPEERAAVVKKSPLKGKYDQAVDSEVRLRGADAAHRTRPPRRPATGQARRAPEARAAGGRRLLGSIGGMLGSIFGTSRPRGQRLSTGQLITREITRSVTNQVAGQIAGQHRQVDRRLDGQLGRPRDRARHAGRDPAPVEHAR